MRKICARQCAVVKDSVPYLSIADRHAEDASLLFYRRRVTPKVEAKHANDFALRIWICVNIMAAAHDQLRRSTVQLRAAVRNDAVAAGFDRTRIVLSDEFARD